MTPERDAVLHIAACRERALAFLPADPKAAVNALTAGFTEHEFTLPVAHRLALRGAGALREAPPNLDLDYAIRVWIETMCAFSIIRAMRHGAGEAVG